MTKGTLSWNMNEMSMKGIFVGILVLIVLFILMTNDITFGENKKQDRVIKIALGILVVVIVVGIFLLIC